MLTSQRPDRYTVNSVEQHTHMHNTIPGTELTPSPGDWQYRAVCTVCNVSECARKCGCGHRFETRDATARCASPPSTDGSRPHSPIHPTGSKQDCNKRRTKYLLKGLICSSMLVPKPCMHLRRDCHASDRATLHGAWVRMTPQRQTHHHTTKAGNRHPNR